MELIINSLSAIGFNWHIAIVNFINFCIILFILKYFFWNKISTLLESRRSKIEEGIRNAEKSETMLTEAEKEKEDMMNEAMAEASVMYKKTMDNAKEVALKMEEEMKNKQETMEEEMKNKMDKANDMAMDNFSKETPRLFKDFITNKLSKNMNPEDNNTIINNLLK